MKITFNKKILVGLFFFNAIVCILCLILSVYYSVFTTNTILAKWFSGFGLLSSLGTLMLLFKSFSVKTFLNRRSYNKEIDFSLMRPSYSYNEKTGKYTPVFSIERDGQIKKISEFEDVELETAESALEFMKSLTAVTKITHDLQKKVKRKLTEKEKTNIIKNFGNKNFN